MDTLSWQDILERFKKQMTEDDSEQLTHFQNLNSDEARGIFCLNSLSGDNNLDGWLDHHVSLLGNVGKDASEYQKLKADGNKSYVKKKNITSLSLYNQAMFHATEGEETALLFANRSAVLFEQNRLLECLQDITLALENGYPEDKLWKLYKRRSEALNKLQRFKESRENCEKAISLIQSNEKLKSELVRLKHVIQTMPTTEDVKHLQITEQSIEIPYKGCSRELKYGSACISLRYNKEEGRYMVADQEIPVGSVIISEEPYAAVLLPLWHKSHCQHCFQNVSLVVPCRRCSQVCYCSETCRESSWKKYHYFECGKLEFLEKFGVARLALRIILVTPLHELLAYQEKDFQTVDPSKQGFNRDGVYEGKYNSVYHLLPNSQHIAPESLFQYSLAGVLLLKILLRFSFLENNNDTLIVQGLLIRHIQQLICNAHAITALNSTMLGDDLSIVEQDQVRLATAIYPTTSLLNHSCEPTTVNSFHRDRLIVKAARNIKAGEQIFNCYGPHYRRMDFSERQSALQQQYFFTCQCLHCSKGMGSSPELNCYSCQKCEQSISSDGCCSNCGTCGNVCTERLNYCRDVDQASSDIFQNGLSLLANSNNNGLDAGVKAALKLFQRALQSQKSVLCKHHKKFGDTYDAIGKCYAMLSNYELSVAHVTRSINIIEMHYGKDSVEITNELLKLSDVYMAWMQELIDQQDKKKINEHLCDASHTIQRALRLVKLNKEAGNEDIELLQERLGSLTKLKYLSQK